MKPVTHTHMFVEWLIGTNGTQDALHTVLPIHLNTPTSTSECLSPKLSNILRQPLKSIDQPHKSLHQSLKSLTPNLSNLLSTNLSLSQLLSTGSQVSLSSSPTLILHHQTDRHPHKPYHSTSKTPQTRFNTYPYDSPAHYPHFPPSHHPITILPSLPPPQPKYTWPFSISSLFLPPLYLLPCISPLLWSVFVVLKLASLSINRPRLPKWCNSSLWTLGSNDWARFIGIILQADVSSTVWSPQT